MEQQINVSLPKKNQSIHFFKKREKIQGHKQELRQYRGLTHTYHKVEKNKSFLKIRRKKELYIFPIIRPHREVRKSTCMGK